MEIISRIIAFFLILILAPLMMLVSIICFISQGTPIFFKQDRVGYKFKNFKIYKFRSMHNNSGPLITQSRDSRVTKIGKFLRKSKIDELPQLINILKGDMRFIGPRPEVFEYFDKNKFLFLKRIKPGISDYASIIFRNESEILRKIGGSNPYKKLLPIKLKLAEYYSNKKCFILDLKLVSITFISIVLPEIASKYLGLSKISADIPEFNDFAKNHLSKIYFPKT